MKIEIQNLSFSYNKKNNNIINDFSYTFESKNCYLVKGSNGSGKTTFSKILCGILKNFQGEIFFDDENIKKCSLGKLSKTIGYLFQNSSMQLFASSLEEELYFPYKLQNKFSPELQNKLDNLLKKFNLFEYKNTHPLLLSQGEKQKLAIATIFIRDIKFILLDEPTSSMDSISKIDLSKIINDFVSNGGGAIIVSHDVEFEKMLNISDTITLKREGKYET